MKNRVTVFAVATDCRYTLFICGRWYTDALRREVGGVAPGRGAGTGKSAIMLSLAVIAGENAIQREAQSLPAPGEASGQPGSEVTYGNVSAGASGRSGHRLL